MFQRILHICNTLPSICEGIKCDNSTYLKRFCAVKSCFRSNNKPDSMMKIKTTGNGRLKFSDYKNLMCSLKHWQVIFRAYTKGTASVFRAEKLRDALLDIEINFRTAQWALDD
ncbi:UNVERIFIED_CONTAM: CalpC [Trichonephila clavipes]